MKKSLFVLCSTFLLAGCGVSDGELVEKTVQPIIAHTQKADEAIDHTKVAYQSYRGASAGNITHVKDVNDDAYTSDVAINELLKRVNEANTPDETSRKAKKLIRAYRDQTKKTYNSYKNVQYIMVQHVNDRDASLAAGIQQQLENAEKQKTKQKRLETKLKTYINKHK